MHTRSFVSTTRCNGWMAAAGRQVGAPVVLVSLVVPALLRPSEAAAARYRVGPGRLYATV
jgi:hypothetical protein